MRATAAARPFLFLVGLLLLLFAGLSLSPASGQDNQPAITLPIDYRYWYHVGSKSIRPEAATAIGLPNQLFDNTFDAVFANDIALNDLRAGTRPFRDGASFVAPFFELINPVAGLDAMGDPRFIAVMVKDSARFADTGGWGFAVFNPDGTDATGDWDCFACHQAQADNDFVFSTLTERTLSAVPAAVNGVFLPVDYRSMWYRGSKVISPEAAAALGLPAEVFGNTFDSIYVNREGLRALSEEIRPFPQGSLFVAEFHQAAFPLDGLAAQGDLAFTAVMLKGAPGTGDDPSTGDWRFEAFAPDGSPLPDLRPACIGCHAAQAANDFVFSGAQ